MTDAVEDRRLKAGGVVLLGLAGLDLSWLANHVVPWSATPDQLVVLFAGTVLGVNLFVVGLLMLVTGCGVPPFWRTERKRQAVLLQILLANVLVPAVMYGVVTSEASVEADLDASGWSLPLSLTATVLGVIAWRMWRRSQKYTAPDAAEAMAEDPRPPVLYLRSFHDDGAPVLDAGGSAILLRIWQALAPQTPEQELAEILAHVGPVVAIGKPGEPLPELGAARLYVAHDQWQRKVTELMRNASLIVIRIGSSAGVLWEIEQALEHVPRQHLVLALLSGVNIAPELSTTLASIVGSQFTDFLPQAAPRGWKAFVWPDPKRRIGSVVCFAADGTPRFVPVSMWPPWGRDMATALMFRPSALPLRRAWRQVFTHLGLEAGRMGGRPSRAIAVGLALFFGYAGAHWFYLGQRRRGWKYVALIPVALASLFMGFFDAWRFVWVDRATFDARFVVLPRAQRTARN